MHKIYQFSIALIEIVLTLQQFSKNKLVIKYFIYGVLISFFNRYFRFILYFWFGRATKYASIDLMEAIDW